MGDMVFMGDMISGLNERNQLKKEVQESKEQVSNPQFPIVESFFARDWLNRFFSLKGEEKLQKFLIRGISEEKLQELLEELNAGKGKLAVIVERPPYTSFNNAFQSHTYPLINLFRKSAEWDTFEALTPSSRATSLMPLFP